MAVNYDKCDKIRQELESDLSKMSEKLSVLKAENFALTKLNGIFSQIKERLFILLVQRTSKPN